MRLLLLLAVLVAVPVPEALASGLDDHDLTDLQTFRTLARECVATVDSRAAGNLVVRVHVAFNGLVSGAEMESRDFRDERLVACILSTFLDRSLFKHAGGSMHVDYLKFRFGPRSPAGLLYLGSGPTPSGSGELTEQAIARVAEGYLNPLTACWRDELRLNPGLRVELDARFLINDDGAVRWSAATPMDGSPRMPALEACAAEALRSMLFPRPRPYRVAQIDFPLLLKPDGTVSPNPVGQRFDIRTQPGFLTRSAIDRTFEPAVEAIEACFRHALRRDAEVSGRIVVDFLVETDGRTEYVSATPDSKAVRSPFLEACIIEVVDGLDFPHPNFGGVVQVRYPLRFEPPASPIAKPH